MARERVMNSKRANVVIRHGPTPQPDRIWSEKIHIWVAPTPPLTDWTNPDRDVVELLEEYFARLTDEQPVGAQRDALPEPMAQGDDLADPQTEPRRGGAARAPEEWVRWEDMCEQLSRRGMVLEADTLRWAMEQGRE